MPDNEHNEGSEVEAILSHNLGCIYALELSFILPHLLHTRSISSRISSKLSPLMQSAATRLFDF